MNTIAPIVQYPQNGSTVNNEEVVDLQYCAATMAVQSVMMSPAVLTEFDQLPQQIQNVMSMISLFRFCKRKRTSQDFPTGRYSASAWFYVNLLQQKGLFLGCDHNDVIAFKCAFCHNARGPHIPGCVSFISLSSTDTRTSFVAAMQHRLNHLCSCPNANRLQAMSRLVTIPQASAYIAFTATERFGNAWMQWVQKKNSFDQMLSEGKPVFIQLNTQHMIRLAEGFWARQVKGLDEQYDDELDFLHRSLMCPSLVSEVFKEETLAKLPALKKKIDDAWVPLPSLYVAQCRDDAALFMDALMGTTCFEATNGQRKPKHGASAPPHLRLHGMVRVCDVVMPTRGCTGDIVQALYDLRGNRRFMRLVSKLRGKYASLSADEERQELVEHIVNTVEKDWGGIFRAASCREIDGEAIVSKSKFDLDKVAYCRTRLEHGFPDVWHIASCRDLSMKVRTSANNGTYIQKVAKAESTPSIGLLSGNLIWRDSGKESSLADILLDDSRTTPQGTLVNSPGTRR